MLALLGLTAAALAHAQVVSVSSVEPNSISLFGETITGSSTTQTITPIGVLTPDLSSRPNSPVVPTHTVSLSIHSENFSCVTVTAAGEPLFTIQTDTALPSGCTRTVYPSAGNGTVVVPPGINATTLTTTAGGSTGVIIVTGTNTAIAGTTSGGGSDSSSSSSSSAAAAAAGSSSTTTTTSNPAATITGRAGWGLAGLGAAVLLL